MKILYHGSPEELTTIEPLSDFLSHDGKIAKVIYASHFMDFAIPFSFTVCNDAFFSSYNVDFSDGVLKRIKTTNCHINYSKQGYLYQLDASTFKQIDSCQWISLETAVHLGFQRIDPTNYKHFIEKSTLQSIRR